MHIISKSDSNSITGTLERIIFKNEGTGFCVCAIRIPHNPEHITARGYLAHLHPGESVALQGSWVHHAKFGRQFEVTHCTVQAPTSIGALQKYLASGLIKGIGPVYAENLIKAFGTDVLTVIEHEPERLRMVPGIGPKRADAILTSWESHKAISHIMVFLQDKGISPSYATKIYKKYGAESIAIVNENPYRLAEEVWGIGFTIADTIAQNLGIPADSLKRIKAAILFVITTAVGNGHLYVTLDALRARTAEILSLSDEQKPLIKHALHALHEQEAIVLVTHEEVHYITRSIYYYTELGVTSQLKQIMTYPALRVFDVHELYTKLRTGHYGSLPLHEDQQRGIMSAFEHKVCIITGGPGTGKTTLIKTLLAMLDEQQVRYKLAAPTGKAAKRMSEATHRSALTLHRLLEFDPAVNGFSRNEKNALVLDLLIIDESSMIDMFLMHALLKALPHYAQVIFIGDTDQLPSVGAGNVLNDLIVSGVVPTTRLTHIFRQAQESLIVTNAHRINRGESLIFPETGTKKDLIFIREQEPEKIAEHLTRVYKTTLPRYGITHHNAVTLSPMKRGIVGTHSLNSTLQQIINPQASTELMHYGFAYRIGDRVMQIKNNYDTMIFNGDTGTITHVNTQDQSVTVKFNDAEVIYTLHDLDELVPAYALSIHKSQGSEFDAVIIVLFMQHFMLLNRNLLYTALTRAKKLCIIIGQPKAVAIAIKNSMREPRCTFLKLQLTTGITCRTVGS